VHDGAAREFSSRNRGALQDGELASREAVEAACEQRVERRRQGLRVAALGRVREELLDEERIAACGAQDLRAERTGSLAEVLQQRLALVARERGKRRRLVLAPVRPLLE